MNAHLALRLNRQHIDSLLAEARSDSLMRQSKNRRAPDFPAGLMSGEPWKASFAWPAAPDVEEQACA
jgi:hypothetical protein